MNTPVPGGGTEEIEFRSSSGYAALIFMFLALLAIPILRRYLCRVYLGVSADG